MEAYLVPAKKLRVYDVVNSKGEDLGQVQDFMIDMASGRVAYAVVAYGGFLGLSDKWFAMPFDALCWSPENKKFLVDLDPDLLTSAPGIDKDKWPDHYLESDTGWLDDLYAHFACTPYWMREGDMTIKLGDTFKTGSRAPVSGVYRFVSHIEEESQEPSCMPTTREIEIPLSKMEVFPPVRSCGKAAMWKLTRIV